MAGSREMSLGLGLALGVAVVAIYDHHMPKVAEARVSDAGDRDLAGAERAATITAAALVGGVSLLAQDATAFVIGGSVIVVYAWMHRHANAYDPVVGSAAQSGVAPIEPTNAYTPAGS